MRHSVLDKLEQEWRDGILKLVMDISRQRTMEGAGLRIAVVATRYHEEVMDGLLRGVERALGEAHVQPEDIRIFRVPGSFEIPLVVQWAAVSGKFDAVVALGCLIKGETIHDEIIARAVAEALQTIARETSVPLGFGVITCHNREQALARSRLDDRNRGADAARAAVEMALLKKTL